MLSRLLRRPVTWLAIGVLAVGAGFGLYWFQPWKLFVDERVDDELSNPVAAAQADPATPDPAPTDQPTGEPTEEPEATTPVLVAEGEFISHEHTTTGTVRLIRNPDGGYQLELVDLDTSNGPDLKVWLTDQPVIEGRDGWHVFDDGIWASLGPLRGNQGNQVYELPADVDPADYSSVSIWCERFSVSFGAATLDPA